MRLQMVLGIIPIDVSLSKIIELAVLDRIFDANHICSAIAFCDDVEYQSDDPHQYVENLMKDAPEIKRDFPKIKEVPKEQQLKVF